MVSGTIHSSRELAQLRALFFDDSLVFLSAQQVLSEEEIKKDHLYGVIHIWEIGINLRRPRNTMKRPVGRPQGSPVQEDAKGLNETVFLYQGDRKGRPGSQRNSSMPQNSALLSLMHMGVIISGTRLAQIPQQGARDHNALDLVRSLEDLRHLDIAHVAFDRVVAHVAGATQHLDRVGGDLHSHIGGEAFSHRCVQAGVLSLIDLVRGLVDQEARGLDLHRHIREHKLDALEDADRMAELLTLARVGAGELEGRLRHADGDGADIDPSTIQRGERDLEALSLRADTICSRDCALLEDQFARGRRMQAQLALPFAEREAGRLLFDDKATDADRTHTSGGTRH